MSKQLIDRQEQGRIISQMNDAVNRINDTCYTVNSQSGNGSYNVNANELGWNCSCPDHIYRGVKCKHIYTVELSFAIRKQVEVVKIEPITNQCCIFCKSVNVVKYGIRHNKNQDIQKYNCMDCNHYFTINLGFEKMHATPQMITTAMQLYFTGESFRNVKQFLKLQGVKMSHVAVYKWIRKYVGLMDAICIDG
jgi:transposase-like protein